MNKIVKITLKDEFAEAYCYLEKLKVNPSSIVKQKVNQAIYETARKFKWLNRQADEKQQNPFSNNFELNEYIC